MNQPTKRAALESHTGTPEPPVREEIPETTAYKSEVTVDDVSEVIDVPKSTDNVEPVENDDLEFESLSSSDEGQELDPLVDSVIDEMEDMLNSEPNTSENVVTVDNETKKAVRGALQSGGPLLFLQQYLFIDPRPVPLPEILAALGFQLDKEKAESYPDPRLELMIQIAMRHFMTQRARLPSPRTLDELVELIKKSSNIIVLSGAGISTSLGIPDFRSDDGLYAQLKGLGLADPQDVFDINLFKQDPTIFYSVAKKILPAEKRYTPTHKFIKLLQDRNKLLRNYTQNIDNLEIEAGIDPEKLVQCHGSFGLAYCFSCFKKVDGSTLFPDILAGKVPRCQPCTAKAKKLEAEEHELPDSFGVYKPEITFFGESLPERFDKLLLEGGDAENCDLLICIGTSLKVAPVSSITKIINREVPQIYISKTVSMHNDHFEMTLLGPCDDVVELLCQKLGWELNHEMTRRPAGQSEDAYPDGAIDYDHDGTYTFHDQATERDSSASAVPSRAATESVVHSAAQSPSASAPVGGKDMNHEEA